MRRPRTKTNPFRILTYSLYGKQEWISRFQTGLDTDISLKLGPARRALGIQSERFREHLSWLEARGYLRDLELGRGWAFFTVRNPSTWNWNGEYDEPADETSDE